MRRWTTSAGNIGMQITVSGKQMELSDALRARVADHLDQIARKYFDHALEVQVTAAPAASLPVTSTCMPAAA